VLTTAAAQVLFRSTPNARPERSPAGPGFGVDGPVPDAGGGRRGTGRGDGVGVGGQGPAEEAIARARPREVTTLALGAIGVGAGALGLRYVVEVRPRRRAATCVLLVGGRWAVARKEVFFGVDRKWVFLLLESPLAPTPPSLLLLPSSYLPTGSPRPDLQDCHQQPDGQQPRVMEASLLPTLAHRAMEPWRRSPYFGGHRATEPWRRSPYFGAQLHLLPFRRGLATNDRHRGNLTTQT
jgi:hypothetical protein